MKTRGFFPYTVYIIAFSLVFLFSACGSDEAAPSIDISSIPHTVFFNDTGTDEFFLFIGRAADNTNVDIVMFSSDNGATWNTAEINNDPPNRLWNVEWAYLASSADLTDGIHTVLVRAADRDGNETTSSPVALEVTSGPTTGDLQAVFSAAADGDFIGLSTGAGFAYGDSATTLTIPIDVGLTVQGSGIGNMLTSGGHSPEGDSIATFLESDPATARLFSIDADLTIRNVRLLGAVHGIYLSDDGGPDPVLSVEDCLFDKQAGWAVYAADDDESVAVEIISSIVDASSANSPSGGGGLYLNNLNYAVGNSMFYSQSAAATGAGILAVSGGGYIDSTVFGGNGLAIWVSGSAASLTSCNITGVASTTNGIDISGNAAMTTIRNNIIEDNNGFGVRVRGNSEPKFFGNSIKSDSITYPEARGIRILDPGSHPEFGRFPYDESGCNRFESSSTIEEDFIFEVDSSTLDPLVIFAGNNYWGFLFDTGTEIRTYKIHDGNDHDNGAAAEVDLTGTPGGVNPVIWNGTGDCP